LWRRWSFLVGGVIANNWKALIVPAAVVILTVAGLLGHSLVARDQGAFGTRPESEIYSLQQAAEMVGKLRQDRIPFVTDKLVVNKVTVSVDELVNRYAFVFDPHRLWIAGHESTYQFSLIVTGFFMVSTLIGLILHWKMNRRHPFFPVFWLLLLVSPVASVLSGYQAIFRSALTYTLILLGAGWGFGSYFTSLKDRNRQVLVILLVGGLLVVEAAWFGLQYFSRYPLLTAENHYLHERVVARYARDLDQPVTIYSGDNLYSLARAVVYYQGLMGELTQVERGQFASPDKKSFTIGNISLTSKCPESLDPDMIQVIGFGRWRDCELDQTDWTTDEEGLLTQLASPLDNGTYYILVDDQYCQGEESRRHVRLTSLNELNLEKLDRQQFCQTWVIKR
jgi:hypothetical protein